MPTIVRENHDNQNATITISIPVSEYQPKFKAELNKLKGKAHLKGFRKGKTPLAVIRKMYGRGVLVDMVNKTLGEELDKYIKEENLSLLGNPIPSEEQVSYEFDTKDLEDFEFKFDIGLAPEFEVQGLDGTEYNYYNAQIPNSMVEGDLENARKQLGTQGSVDDEIQAEDVIKIQADELEGDSIKERGFANEFSVAYNNMTEEAKETFKGKKRGDLVEFDIFNLEEGRSEEFVRKYFLDVNEDAEEQPVIGNRFRAVISDVTRVTPSEMNQAFFDKYVGEGKVSSEEELMEILKERTKMYYDRQADSLLFMDIKENLEKENPLTFPEEFMKRWMVASGNLPKDTTADAAIDNLTEGMVWSMIVNKLTKRFEIKVSEGEVKQALRQQLIQMFGGQDFGAMLDEYVDKMYGEEQQRNNAYNQVLSDKLFYAMKEVVILKNKDVTTEELENIIKEENAKNQPPVPESVEELAEPVEEDGIEEAEVVEE